MRNSIIASTLAKTKLLLITSTLLFSSGCVSEPTANVFSDENPKNDPVVVTTDKKGNATVEGTLDRSGILKDLLDQKYKNEQWYSSIRNVSVETDDDGVNRAVISTNLKEDKIGKKYSLKILAVVAGLSSTYFDYVVVTDTDGNELKRSEILG